MELIKFLIFVKLNKMRMRSKKRMEIENRRFRTMVRIRINKELKQIMKSRELIL